MQSILSFVVFILEDPNYYNVSADELAKELGTINSIAEACVIVQDLYMGLIQDKFGRKIPIVFGLILLGVAIGIIPLFT